MNYKTFRMLFVGVGSAVVVLGGITVYKVVEERDKDRRLAAVKMLHEAQEERQQEARMMAKAQAKAQADAKTAAASAPAAAIPAAKVDGDVLRPIDKALLEHLAKNFAGDRPKDVFPGAPYKVNFARKGSEFRLKLDLNRDGHWDEKWTASNKDGQPQVKRQVAPADDERYTNTYHLDGAAWHRK